MLDLFPQAAEETRAVLPTSQPFLVGKTWWRFEAIHNPHCSAYPYTWRAEWRDRLGAWRPHREWPTYNINNGMTLGLPKSLGRLGDTFCSRYRDYMAIPADVRARVEARIAEHRATQ
jgi:hypothetical protein